MKRRRVGLVVLGLGLLAVAPAPSQPARPAEKFVPRLEPVAETRLLMEGLNQSNFRGLETMLKQKPADLEGWVFARGQALLIAETGNLLLLRPPKNQGRDTWQMRATELRDSATALARTIAKQDLEGSRAALGTLATSCNRCHQTFGVQVKVAPFRQPPPGERGAD